MPNTTSAKKALRQNSKRRLQNRTQRSALRTAVKKARAAITGGEGQAEDVIREAQKTLDRAADKNLIHKNAASRLKSRLAKLAKKQSGAKPAG